MSFFELPILARLRNAKHVLIAGAGGGFDVFAGLPLAPEVYAFEKVGAAPLRAAYTHLVSALGVDAIVLVDGGTDILMRGDEAGLGTPEEDVASLAAVSALGPEHGVTTRLVSCLGFGIDTFHGVCHAHFLENVAALEAEGAFLGAHSVQLTQEATQCYRSAVEYVHERMPARMSIVQGSVLSALEGRFGDVHRSARTQGGPLFINPLMSLYWHFELAAIAARSLYLPRLAQTETAFDVSRIIEGFRREVTARPRTVMPV